MSLPFSPQRRIRRYFSEEPLEIHSPLSPDEASKRLSEAVGSRFQFLMIDEGLVGSVRGRSLSISYRRPPLRNSFKPVLRAEIEASGDGCVVRGTYGLHPMVGVFLVVWVGMALTVGGGAFLVTITGGNLSAALLFVAGVVAMVAFAAGLTWLGLSLGRRDIDDIERRLWEVLEAG